MKINTEELEETIIPVKETDLIYGIDDRPPLKETLFAALQHLLAIFVAIITPPLIIAGALKLDLETTGFLVSMALFASGVSTFIQCKGRVALYTGYEFFFYRTDHLCRPGWRVAAYLWCLYGCRSGRDDYQPYI